MIQAQDKIPSELYEMKRCIMEKSVCLFNPGDHVLYHVITREIKRTRLIFLRGGFNILVWVVFYFQ